MKYWYYPSRLNTFPCAFSFVELGNLISVLGMVSCGGERETAKVYVWLMR